MKTLRLLAGILGAFLAVALWAKDAATYPCAEAKAHLGEQATVVGKVSGVHVTSRGDTLLNFGAPYPNNNFTAVVFADDGDKFGDLSSLEGKIVRVTGLIKDYKGKPEIVVGKPELLQVDSK